MHREKLLDPGYSISAVGVYIFPILAVYDLSGLIIVEDPDLSVYEISKNKFGNIY